MRILLRRLTYASDLGYEDLKLTSSAISEHHYEYLDLNEAFPA